MNIMVIFHPNNNLGVEVFCIGVSLMLLFDAGFIIWYWLSDRRYRKKVK